MLVLILLFALPCKIAIDYDKRSVSSAGLMILSCFSVVFVLYNMSYSNWIGEGIGNRDQIKFYHFII